MSDQLRESVSAVMDGEADELELRRVLSKDNADVVRSTWSRYHAVRDAMQGNQAELSFSGWDISSRVSQAIEEETVTVSKPQWRASWLRPAAGSAVAASIRPAAGFAVAASVAFAVVVGVQSLQPTNVGNEPAVFAAQPTATNRVYPVHSSIASAPGNMRVGVNYDSAGVLPGASAASKAAADNEAQKRLEKYILRHTQRAALNNGSGLISFARVANFETE